jgi:uncharacterized protein YyaL (SSP411 family)
MLYVRKLEIVDETDTTVLTIKNKDAIFALNTALKVVNQKEGGKRAKGLIRKFLKDLDQEFKEYFDMG